jgi:hypothetical protein
MTMQTVAMFLTFHIDASGKTQKEIAREVGFPKPNVLSMLKSGETKLPLARAGAMADALGIPRSLLIRMCLQEYEPEVWGVIQDSLPGALLTDAEVEVIELLRKRFGSP